MQQIDTGSAESDSVSTYITRVENRMVQADSLLRWGQTGPLGYVEAGQAMIEAGSPTARPAIRVWGQE